MVRLTQLQHDPLPRLTTDDPQCTPNALIELDLLFKPINYLGEPLYGLVRFK